MEQEVSIDKLKLAEPAGLLIQKIDQFIPVEAFVKKIESMPELWKENTWRQDYVVELERPVSPQKDTQAIMFRWAPQNTIESVRDSLEVVEHPNFRNIQEIQELLVHCLVMIDAQEVGRVFIANLKPGGVVIPHCDFGMYSDHFERFHLVLTSDPGNVFFVQDTNGFQESSHMRPGEFFWFNHKEAHWAVNNSNTPRMHLIIDAVAPKYRRERASV